MIVLSISAVSYGNTTPVTPKEKEKVVIVAGSYNVDQVVFEVLKKDFATTYAVVGNETKKDFDSFVNLKAVYAKDILFDPVEPMPDIREIQRNYKYLNEPLKLKPLNYKDKFDRTARNAI